MKTRFFTACLALLGLTLAWTTDARAAFVSLTGSPVAINAIPGGILVAGENQYSNFSLDGFSFGGAIAPNASFFLVQGGFDDLTNQFGLRFLTAMNAGQNQVTNANLSFRVDVLPSATPPGMVHMIDAVTMVLSGVSATGSGIVNASETVFGTSTPFPALANLSVSAQQGSPLSQLFDTEVLPNPLSTIFIRKDISVSGGATIGGAHLSEFYQYYDQTLVQVTPVPEPGILALAGCGIAGIGYWNWKRKRNDDSETLDA